MTQKEQPDWLNQLTPALNNIYVYAKKTEELLQEVVRTSSDGFINIEKKTIPLSDICSWRFPIVTIIGSSKERDTFAKLAMDFSLNGKLVLVPPVFETVDRHLTPEQENHFVQLGYQRMLLADEIVVISRNFHIGDSTTKELKYIMSFGFKVKGYDITTDKWYFVDTVDDSGDITTQVTWKGGLYHE